MNVTSPATFVAVALITALLTSQTAIAQQTSPFQTSAVNVQPAPSAPTPSIAKESTVEAPTGPGTPELPASGIVDIALQEDGIIRGRVLHADGRPIDGSRVVIKKGDRVVAAVISETNGQFQVKGLSSGVYQIETPTGFGTYRFWTRAAAPPSAMTHALVVAKEPVLRGQFEMLSPMDTLNFGFGVAGVTLGAISLSELNDQDEKIKRLEQALQEDDPPVSP